MCIYIYIYIQYIYIYTHIYIYMSYMYYDTCMYITLLTTSHANKCRKRVVKAMFQSSYIYIT